MYRQISGNGITEGLKIQNFLGEHAPRPPRGELAKLVPSPSPVTIHYSPATTFLNENPGKAQSNARDFCSQRAKAGLVRVVTR